MRQPFYVHCGKCQHEWAVGFLPLPADVAGRLKARCPLCQSKDQRLGEIPRATPGGDPIAWLSSGDTGVSSKAIWHVMMGRRPSDNSVPWDPDDFGRCYRLLKVMPEWRSRLSEVAEKFPAWRGLVDQWDELTALYEQELPQGTAPKLYARMRQLTERA